MVVYSGRIIGAEIRGPWAPDGRTRVLEVRRDDGSVARLRSLQRTGRDWFSWGTQHAGTLELTWAVLADFLGEDVNDRLAFALERYFAALDPDQEWVLDEARLSAWVANRRRELGGGKRRR